MTSQLINMINRTESLPKEQWGEFFDQFSESNFGRHISIEIIDPNIGDEVLIQNAPLLAIIYDRPGKGDSLAIETGKDQMNYAHSIDSPTDISTGENSSGETRAIWISEATGRKTLIKLQVS